MAQDLENLKRHPAVLRLYLSKLRFHREGREYVAACPEHKDNTPSLHLFQKDGQPFLYKCFGQCGKSGSIIDFVQLVDNCDLKTAIRTVEEYCGQSWEGTKDRVEKVFRPASPEVAPKDFKTYTLEQWKPLEEALWRSRYAVEWLRSRGIALDTAKSVHLAFRESLPLVKEKDKDIENSGWVGFPCLNGDVIECIKWRSIVRKVFYRSPGMKTTLYNTNSIDILDPVFLVEGEFDALTLTQAGFRAVSLASASHALTAEDKDLLLGAEYLILAGDSDEAGDKVMTKLWTEVQERCYRLKWNGGCKDANEVFLKTCSGDVAKFRELVLELVERAKGQPAPNIYSLQEVLLNSENTSLVDHPNRLRFMWPSVDSMFVALPGSIITIMATTTGLGKSTFCMNFTLDAARRHGEVVLSYQTELSPEEVANMVCAHVLKRDRNRLTSSDRKNAAKLLGSTRYFIGRDSTLTNPSDIIDLIEAGIRRLGATVVVVDHIHWLCRNEKDEIKAQAQSMQRLKNLAVKYQCKVVVVGQPRKANQSDRNKVPTLSDFKGSESLQSDADVSLALHRNTVKGVDPEHPPNDLYDPNTEIHLLKARAKGDGAAVSSLFFLGKQASFIEASQVVRDEPATGLFK